MPIDPIRHTDKVLPHADSTKPGHTDIVVAPHSDIPAVHNDAAKIHTDVRGTHSDVIDRLPEEKRG